MKLDRLFYGFVILSTLVFGCESGTIKPPDTIGKTVFDNAPTPPPATDEPTGTSTPAAPLPSVMDDPASGLTPAPTGCAVGEVEDWGPEGIYPRIAGGPSGYAVVVNGNDAQIRMVSPDGTPTSPVGIMPSVAGMGWPNVVSGKSGFIASDDANYDDGDHNLVVYKQDGSVKSSALGLSNTWSLQVAGGDTKDRLLWTAFPFDPQSQVWVATLSEAGDVTGGRSILGYDHTNAQYDICGFAAKGDSVAFGFRTQWLANGVGSDVRLLEAMVYDGSSLKSIELTKVIGDASLWVNRVVATPDGFTALWTRYVTQCYQPAVVDSYLTFLGTDGSFKGTVKVPAAKDMAWNGQEYGIVGYDDELETVSFHRLAPDGTLRKSVTVAAERVHYESMPAIAASGLNFAIVWATDNSGPYPNTTVKFVPISCQ